MPILRSEGSAIWLWQRWLPGTKGSWWNEGNLASTNKLALTNETLGFGFKLILACKFLCTTSSEAFPSARLEGRTRVKLPDPLYKYNFEGVFPLASVVRS